MQWSAHFVWDSPAIYIYSVISMIIFQEFLGTGDVYLGQWLMVRTCEQVNRLQVRAFRKNSQTNWERKYSSLPLLEKIIRQKKNIYMYLVKNSLYHLAVQDLKLFLFNFFVINIDIYLLLTGNCWLCRLQKNSLGDEQTLNG